MYRVQPSAYASQGTVVVPFYIFLLIFCYDLCGRVSWLCDSFKHTLCQPNWS